MAEIIRKINTSDNWVGNKIQVKDSLWIALVNNLEKFQPIVDFISPRTELYDKVFINTINFNWILKNEVKTEYINADNHITCIIMLPDLHAFNL